jgi:hypothetical protein
METEQYTVKWSVSQQRNKTGIKKFLELGNNENTIYKNVWDTAKEEV